MKYHTTRLTQLEYSNPVFTNLYYFVNYRTISLDSNILSPNFITCQ